MWDRLSGSFALAESCWNVLRREKQLIIFPIVSGIGCLLVLASFAIPMALLFPWGQAWNAQAGNVQLNGETRLLAYLLAFAFYFCNYFVIIFCNAGLVSCALMCFNGETASVASGFRAAASRLPQILAWALVSATVGVLLKVVENAHEKAGQLISALLGTAWTIMTYFVVPVLVVERVGPVEAVSRSMSILRKTWGEALVGRFGLGLILMLLFLPGVALVALGAVAAATNGVLAVVLIALGALYTLLWAAAGSALNVIFLSALYQYAALGEAPDGFPGQTLRQAFGAKSGRSF